MSVCVCNFLHETYACTPNAVNVIFAVVGEIIILGKILAIRCLNAGDVITYNDVAHILDICGAAKSKHQ
jgi:hypothetical protein